MKRYTVSITKPIEAADLREDPEGRLVGWAEVEPLIRRVEVARGLLGAAFVGPDADLRSRIGKALDALEGQPRGDFNSFGCPPNGRVETVRINDDGQIECEQVAPLFYADGRKGP
jgi:hypothetical protein